MAGDALPVKAGLALMPQKSKRSLMSDQKISDATARAKAEQKAKLSEQLRANLRRRKAQSREMDGKEG